MNIKNRKMNTGKQIGKDVELEGTRQKKYFKKSQAASMINKLNQKLIVLFFFQKVSVIILVNRN